jgi:hypothetical protein
MVAPIQPGMLGLYSSKKDLHNLKCYEYEVNKDLDQFKIRKEMSDWITAHLFCNPNEMIYGLTTGSNFTSGVQDR